MSQPIIALLTDFGLQDRYVGVMKGVMSGICPEARFIDITHEISPQNVRQAAFQLMDAVPYFPESTIFLIVVDPGVGTTRRSIAVQTGQYVFVAPDNGVLSYTLKHLGEFVTVELGKPEFWLDGISNTFHGRDLFAPIAAHLASGKMLDDLGNRIDSVIMLPTPNLAIEGRAIIAEVLDIDRFGNVITSVGKLNWITDNRLTLAPYIGELDNEANAKILANEAVIQIGSHSITSIKPSYGEVGRGDVLALVGSSGFLEIAVNQGNAALRLDVSIGDPVTVEVGDIHAAILD